MISKYVAAWRSDTESLYKNADAQKVADEIYSLGDNPTTEDILEMAKAERTETHKLIEWDDKVAAGKYRTQQVRGILHNLQMIEIKVLEDGTEKKVEDFVPIRAFYHLREESGYRPTVQIIENKDLNEKLLATAKAELNSFMVKYSILTELEPVFEAIRNL